MDFLKSVIDDELNDKLDNRYRYDIKRVNISDDVMLTLVVTHYDDDEVNCRFIIHFEKKDNIYLVKDVITFETSKSTDLELNVYENIKNLMYNDIQLEFYPLENNYINIISEMDNILNFLISIDNMKIGNYNDLYLQFNKYLKSCENDIKELSDFEVNKYYSLIGLDVSQYNFNLPYENKKEAWLKHKNLTKNILENTSKIINILNKSFNS